jgi:hypothetical protein
METFSSTSNNSRVLNIISSGPDGELYLTFTFEWEHAEIEEGSQEHFKKQKEYQAAAPRGVAGALATIRKMVQEGRF